MNTTRGWSFTVSSRIVIDQLGSWDSGQDGLATPHGVGGLERAGCAPTHRAVRAGSCSPYPFKHQVEHRLMEQRAGGG